MERRQFVKDAAVLHWTTLAERCKDVPRERLSFDLINEPPWVRPWEGYLFEGYDEIVRALVVGIREHSPDRLIFVDGLDIGQTPVPDIIDVGVAQSTRGYLPQGSEPLHRGMGAPERVRDLRRSQVALEGRRGKDLGPGPTQRGSHRALEGPGREGCGRPRGRVGLLQQDAPRRGPGLDGRLPLAVEGGGLGVGPVEPPRRLRDPRLGAH